MSFQYKALTIALLGFALTACGGSHRSEYENQNPPTPTPKALSGTVVDFYIAGATVKCGATGATTQTKADGTFEFTGGCADTISVSGGTDVGTGLPFTGQLQFPKGVTNSNTISINPLTTLLAISGVSNPTEAANLAAKLGLSGKDLLTTDPMKDKALLQAAVSVQQLITQIEKVLTEVAKANGATLTPAQIEASVQAALKTQMANATTFNVNNIASLPVQSLIETAILQTKDSLPANVAANINAIAKNTAALTASTVAQTVSQVSDAVKNANTDASGTVILTAAVTAPVTESANSQTTENILAAVNPTILATAGVNLTALGAAIASGDSTAITAAINTSGLPNDQIAALQNKVNDLVTADQYSNYLGLLGLSFGNTNFSIANVLASNGGAPLSVQAPLDQFKLYLSQFGTAFGAAKEAKLGVSYEINATKKVNFIFDKVTFDFNATTGAITSFKLPANVNYVYTITGGSTSIPSSSYTNQKENSYNIKDGAVSLPLDDLLDRVTALNPAFKKEDYKPVSGDTVTLTVTLAPTSATNTLRVGTGSGANAQASAGYSVTANNTTLVGTGVKAAVKVQ